MKDKMETLVNKTWPSFPYFMLTGLGKEKIREKGKTKDQKNVILLVQKGSQYSLLLRLFC